MQSITLLAGLGHKSRASRACAAVKLNLRALAHPVLTHGWLEMLNSHHSLQEIALLQPRLIHKIYRPYLSGRLTPWERLIALTDHYRFVLEHELAPLVTAATRGAVTLAAFSGKSGAEYRITLRAIVPMEREGELVLQLHCGERLVQSVAFSFVREGTLNSVYIGCLQGPQCGEGLELSRAATRDLHGMRPKQMLVRIVQHLGHAFGCIQLLMVGNHNRSVRKQLRKGRVHADYDAFWQELGASPRPDGDFLLLCSPPVAPDLETIASKKRAEARRRHDLVVELMEQLMTHIPGTLRPAMVA